MLKAVDSLKNCKYVELEVVFNVLITCTFSQLFCCVNNKRD